MIIKFKTIRELVEHICTENPLARDDDSLLTTLYWQHRGIDISEDLVSQIIKSTKPETISRARRALQEVGKIPSSKEAHMRRTDSMNQFQNHYLTEKEQEEISKGPTIYEDYQDESGKWFIREKI